MALTYLHVHAFPVGLVKLVMKVYNTLKSFKGIYEKILPLFLVETFFRGQAKKF